MSRMDTDKLIIGYSGSLNGYNPRREQEEGVLKKSLQYIWDYKVKNINSNTRSGFYLFQAIKCFIKKYPDKANLVRVELWGMINNINATQVNEFGLSDIINISGYCPKQQSFEKLMNCDVLFLPLESSKDGQRPLFIPGKLYEYLKTSKPIISLAEESDCTEILLKSGLGIVCSPYDPEAIADQILFLLNNKDELSNLYSSNIEYIESNFKFSEVTKRMAGIFNEVLNQE